MTEGHQDSDQRVGSVRMGMTLHVISDSEVSGFKICSVCHHSYSNLFVYCNIHFC